MQAEKHTVLAVDAAALEIYTRDCLLIIFSWLIDCNFYHIATYLVNVLMRWFVML